MNFLSLQLVTRVFSQPLLSQSSRDIFAWQESKFAICLEVSWEHQAVTVEAYAAAAFPLMKEILYDGKSRLDFDDENHE